MGLGDRISFERLHHFLRPIFRVERRFCLGRPVRLHADGLAGDDSHPAAAPASRKIQNGSMENGMGHGACLPHCAARFCHLLASARGLPSDDHGTSDLCRGTAIQEHRWRHSGQYEEWGLTNTWMWDDPWQRFHSTTPYFMPFMLWRDGSVKPCIAYALIAAWFLVLAALISVLLLLRAKARGWGFEERSAG